MTTESIAVPLNDSKEHGSAASFSVAMLRVTVYENLKLLLLGPAIVGVVMFAIVSAVPPSYTSVAYLKIDEAGARTVDALMHSPSVLDKVLAGFKAPQDTVEARRRFLDAHRRIVVAPGEMHQTANLHLLEYSDRDPRVAQEVNSLFIDAWLDSAKPTPEKRMMIEAEIPRRELAVKSVSELIDRLLRGAPPPDARSSLESDRMGLVVEMIRDRDKNLAAIASLRNSLMDVSRETFFSAPDLPTVPSWPNKGVITVLAGFVAEMLLLIFVISRRLSPA